MLDVIRQDTDWSCFAASLAMVTGIDYDIMDKRNDAAPGSWPAFVGWTVDPEDSIVGVDESWATVYDWAEALEPAYDLQVHPAPIVGREGILMVMVAESASKNWSHAVAIDKWGYATCPSATFDEFHLTEFEDSCNLIIAGFVTVKEK